MSDHYEAADNFNDTRTRMAPFIGFLILALQQGVIFAWEWSSTSTGALVQIAIWLLFATIMLLLLLSGGGWFLSHKARKLANDEPSRANRDRAIRIGFVVSVITCFLVVAISPFEPLPAQRAAHIISSMGLGTAFLALGMTERTAHG